ncbi:hypothetical protein D9M71_506020 [compost metagenome]
MRFVSNKPVLNNLHYMKKPLMSVVSGATILIRVLLAMYLHIFILFLLSKSWVGKTVTAHLKRFINIYAIAPINMIFADIFNLIPKLPVPNLMSYKVYGTFKVQPVSILKLNF